MYQVHVWKTIREEGREGWVKGCCCSKKDVRETHPMVTLEQGPEGAVDKWGKRISGQVQVEIQ